jgi:hypothetical protein
LSRSEFPYASCGALRRALELYAEGELRDRRYIVRIRGHLEECDACSDYLAFYDELTAGLLSDATASRAAGSRVESILESISLDEPRPEAAVVEAVVVEAGSLGPVPLAREARASVLAARRPRTTWRVSLRAAAAFVIAALAALWFLPRSPDGAGVAVDGTPDPDRASSGLRVASAEEASTSESSRAQADGGLRWVLDDGRDRGPDRHASLLRLYGFRPQLALFEGAADAGETKPRTTDAPPSEWIVDARPGATRARARGGRVYLIAEEPALDARGPVEIDPVCWFAARARPFRRPGGSAGPAAVYRVYVIEDPALLPTELPADASRFAVPALDTSRRSPQWTLPAAWTR